MNQREGSGHYGALLFVYQCTECQGIWVDGDVVAALSHDSAVEAEADVDISEISTEPRETAILCPRCSVNLMEQSGGGLPPGLRVDYCNVCNGFWFDKGELEAFPMEAVAADPLSPEARKMLALSELDLKGSNPNHLRKGAFIPGVGDMACEMVFFIIRIIAHVILRA